MTDDFQSIVIDRLKKLETNVKSLKSSHKKLFNKFNEIEIQDFHDQIQALNKRIDNLERNLLNTQRVLAYFYIDDYQAHMLREVEDQRMNPNVRETIVIEQTKVREKVETSTEPLKIVYEFAQFCAKYSKQMGIRAFRDLYY
jgi:protein subunit release factor A